mmetsp:Transcript_51091/g.91751  ORF Transcript_51091/g.91751 Transcript_51091/m.91751 type:complete len:211 (-) Transcript_51091:1525-2157(-)
MPADLQAPQCLLPLGDFHSLIDHRLHFLENGALDLVDCVIFESSIQLRWSWPTWRKRLARRARLASSFATASTSTSTLSISPWHRPICVSLSSSSSSLLIVPLGVLSIPLRVRLTLFSILLFLLSQVCKGIILLALGSAFLLRTSPRLSTRCSRGQVPRCLIRPFVVVVELSGLSSVDNPIRLRLLRLLRLRMGLILGCLGLSLGSSLPL